MRDLANQNFNIKKPKATAKFLRLILLIVVLAAIFPIGKFFLKPGSLGESSIVLREAPRNLKPINVDLTESINSEGVNLITQSATFKDVQYGGEANATATRSFGGGTYILSVDATLPDPVNTNYQVWLVSGQEVIPINFMNGSKNTWSLRLRSSDKYSNYDGIWITLERTKDELPEEHILEGSF
ncbi:hypothetical protein A3F02_02420 [Candidatus Curtissbacteria bacterium RIFCSPHIGHO2_12_FULL_38_9b]|uniref:Anti-sigma factor n=2 Tax=Candidatus Curtissiibacteriota TaxID=1752717 RepID=A0A1F5GWJ8_9BACT|nr:MAG: hypothetical protein A3A48_01310 [Candidatus Curtissbacteria bacterium RIFCSPLOWO2_01_FULL_37_9]OGD96231.1 MAG: hypothetical protein A3F02_02420 [Candidatus Curtissbacteria bacterium RIFCSPHIGHO2_12_FULL_38_9b]